VEVADPLLAFQGLAWRGTGTYVAGYAGGLFALDDGGRRR